MPTAAPHRPSSSRQLGVVLPVALIMLVIISLAGLLAARNAATHEQFSNNLRTAQVARQSAEAALRYCETVAIGIANETGHEDLKSKIVSTAIGSDQIASGAWNTKANWASGATNLITYTPAFDSTVKAGAKMDASLHPTCIIQSMTDNRYLVTTRSLSKDAVLSKGELVQGAEIWMQSILSPGTPIKAAGGGIQ